MTVLLEASGLEVGYTRVPILSNVSVNCEKDKITTIVGPNGCGKSTLLKAIIGFLRPRKGKVCLDGQNITGWSPERLLVSGLSLVPQARSIFPKMTVEENLRLGGYILVRRKEIRLRMNEVLQSYPLLAERRHQLAGTLSGGEQRLLELGRALMLKPRLLLLDEPSAMLAPVVLDFLFGQIRQTLLTGTSIVLVEQNIQKAFEITDYVYALDYGCNFIQGTPDECMNHPGFRALYLG